MSVELCSVGQKEPVCVERWFLNQLLWLAGLSLSVSSSEGLWNEVISPSLTLWGGAELNQTLGFFILLVVHFQAFIEPYHLTQLFRFPPFFFYNTEPYLFFPVYSLHSVGDVHTGQRMTWDTLRSLIFGRDECDTPSCGEELYHVSGLNLQVFWLHEEVLASLDAASLHPGLAPEMGSQSSGRFSSQAITVGCCT